MKMLAAQPPPRPICAQRKIGTFGLFGGGNLGNDGSLEAVLSSLRRVMPEADVGCICARPVEVAKRHPILTLPMRTPPPSHALFQGLALPFWKALREIIDWPATFWRVCRFEVILVPGTGILDDFGDRPWGMPLTILRLSLMAKLAGTRIWLVSIGAGPINHPLSRRLMLWAAKLADYRSYRDTISRDYMASIGLDTRHDCVYPDVAFSLPAPAPDADRTTVTHRLSTIGVGVMAYYGWKSGQDGPAIHARYLKRITTFVVWLIEEGYWVRLLTGENSDERVVGDIRRAVAARMPELSEDRIVTESARSLHDVMTQMLECEAVLATRFHNVVCALRLGKPTISIGYAAKFDALMTDMGLSDYCQNIEQLDIDRLKDQFRRLLANGEVLARNIRAKTLQYQQHLREQDEHLAAMLRQE
jgi:polysaccharide pyruvyl transferase WcaK-like protein